MDHQKKQLSPILQTYSNVALSDLVFDTAATISTIAIPEPPKQFSHTVFTAISTPRLLRSKTSPVANNSSSNSKSTIVHNTWV
jgi:hypothetical protein